MSSLKNNNNIITNCFVVIIINVFLMQIIFSGMSEKFLLDSNLIITEPWRVISYQFLHGGIIHLGANLLVLISFGFIIERVIGSKNYIILFLISSIAGALGIYITSLIGAPGRAVGISVFLMTLISFYVCVQPKDKILLIIIPMPLWVGFCLIVGLDTVNLILQIFGDGLIPYLGSAGHLSGVITGYCYHKYMMKHPKKVLKGQ